MKRASRICTSVFALSFAFAPARGDSDVMRPDKDNSIYQNNDWTSNGAGWSMYSGQTGSFGIRRALMSFDIAGEIPAGSTINSASLQLRLTNSVSGNKTMNLHRLLADWGEEASDAGSPGGNGWQAEPGDATWVYNFYTTSSWASPGGDFSPTISGTASVGSVFTDYTWTMNAAGIADVQSWLDNPGQNFGWILRGNEVTSRSAKEFGSREHEDPIFQPRLTVDYTVPEPASAALLLVGLLAIARKRSKASSHIWV